MKTPAVYLADNNIKFGFAGLALGFLLMGGILLVKWIPGLYMVFPAPLYLNLHVILEFVSIVVSMAVFLVAWYNFQHTHSIHELVLCLSFLAVGIIDIAHTLSYDGMPGFFTPNSVNKASTYWIIMRLVRAIGLFGAVFAYKVIRKRRVNPALYLVFTLAVVSGILVTVAIDPAFIPRMFIPGEGQTAAKVVLEYVGISLEGLALIYLVSGSNKNTHDRYLEAALLFLIFSSVAFTMYSSAYDTFNLIGHVYMIIGFICILRGLFIGSVVRLFEANRLLEEQKEKLAEINSQLEKINQYKSDFLANTNHELRTPLTSIIAFTEFLLDKETGPLNEIQKDYLMEINDSSYKLLVEINNLLDLSKLEAGQIKLKPELCRAVEIADEALKQMRPIFRQKKQVVQVAVPDNLPDIYLDRDKIRKVLINLLSNANKFTPPGGEITVSAGLFKDKLVIKVTDNGIGFSKEEACNIFDKFYMIDSLEARRQIGTGLGLSIVKHFIDLHQGIITVDSNPGEGCTFSLHLPCKISLEEVPTDGNG